jgi:hypothetical protein
VQWRTPFNERCALINDHFVGGSGSQTLPLGSVGYVFVDISREELLQDIRIKLNNMGRNLWDSSVNTAPSTVLVTISPLCKI